MECARLVQMLVLNAAFQIQHEVNFLHQWATTSCSLFVSESQTAGTGAYIVELPDLLKSTGHGEAWIHRCVQKWLLPDKESTMLHHLQRINLPAWSYKPALNIWANTNDSWRAGWWALKAWKTVDGIRAIKPAKGRTQGDGNDAKDLEQLFFWYKSPWSPTENYYRKFFFFETYFH